MRSNGNTTIENTTFSGNHSDGAGGGIDNSDPSNPSAALYLTNVTLYENSAGSGGGNLNLGSHFQRECDALEYTGRSRNPEQLR